MAASAAFCLSNTSAGRARRTGLPSPSRSSIAAAGGVRRLGGGRRRVCRAAGAVRMQVWSDPKVTSEYMEFLRTGKSDSEDDLPEDCASIIVGSGRIGDMMLSAGKGEDVVVKRGEPIPADMPGPVYVCTRNDSLEEIIKNCPENKRADLVFLQNGMLEPLLQKYALQDEATLVNVYFAVARKGARPQDGVTDTNPEGLTAATGKWARAMRQRLERKKLTCKVLNRRDFRRSMLEKLIWISAFMLIGSVHGNITVGEVEAKHRDELQDMVDQMASMIRATLAVVMTAGLFERLCAYARAVEHFPTAVKEFPWRNGWFYGYSELALKRGFDDLTPMHTNYLVEGREQGLISWP